MPEYKQASNDAKKKMARDWEFVKGSSADVAMESPVKTGSGRLFKWKLFLKKSYVSLQIDPVKRILRSEDDLGKTGESIRTAVIEQLVPFKPEGKFIPEVDSYSITFDKTISYLEIVDRFVKRVDETLQRRFI